MDFISPTKGKITEQEMLGDILRFISESARDSYRLIVGSDSQPGRETCFVTAVIIHREGKGARCYYTRNYHKNPLSLKHRIFEEASRSLDVAGKILNFMTAIHPELTIEIHCDVGEKGKTREFIQQIVSMINMSGYMARVKPYSYGASTVADRFTK